jgi:hypothetical protein
MLGVIYDLAGGRGVRQSLGFDLHDVGDVSGADHDRTPLGEGRWLGRHSRDLMKEPKHVFLQGALYIH